MKPKKVKNQSLNNQTNLKKMIRKKKKRKRKVKDCDQNM